LDASQKPSYELRELTVSMGWTALGKFMCLVLISSK
jgi:hypothetical protein